MKAILTWAIFLILAIILWWQPIVLYDMLSVEVWPSGTGDDTALLQSKIDEVGQRTILPNRVMLHRGTYIIRESLVLSKQIHIVGKDMESTIIRLED